MFFNVSEVEDNVSLYVRFFDNRFKRHFIEGNEVGFHSVEVLGAGYPHGAEVTDHR
jgi:hypothetical protein